MAVLQGSVWRLTVLIGDGERWHRRPLFEEIVRRAQQRGMAGVTVLHGIEGFGAGGRVHTDRILSLCEDLPIQLIVVDEEQRIRDFLPQVEELVLDGLVLLDRVGVVRHVTGQQSSAG
jgi:PII-like signaling protein